MVDTIRKGRVRFFGHIMRMDNNRLTKQIFNHVHKSKNGIWRFQEIKKDMEEMGITEDVIQDRTTFRRLIQTSRVFKRGKRRK